MEGDSTTYCNVNPMTAVEKGIEENQHEESDDGDDDHIEQGRVDRVVHHLCLERIVNILPSDLQRERDAFKGYVGHKMNSLLTTTLIIHRNPMKRTSKVTNRQKKRLTADILPSCGYPWMKSSDIMLIDDDSLFPPETENFN